jgi:hypothetical protein
VLDHILKIIGATDSAIAVMGPTLTVVLSFVFSFAATQRAKQYVALMNLPNRAYDVVIPTLSSVFAFGFANLLGGLGSWVLEAGFAFVQPIVVWAILQWAWRRWPWLKPGTWLGSSNPDEKSIQAAIDGGKPMRKAIVEISQSGRYKVLQDIDTQRLKTLQTDKEGSDDARGS